MSPPREIPPSDDGDALVAIAQQQKKQKPARPAPADEPEMPDALFDGDEADDADDMPKRRPRRLPLTDDGIVPPEAVKPEKPRAKAEPKADKEAKADKAKPKAKEPEERKPRAKRPDPGPGLVTKGVHAGLRGVDAAQDLSRRLGAWGIAALAAAVLVIALGVAARTVQPAPAKVTGLRVAYTGGPQIADREMLAMVRGFPDIRRLDHGDRATLGALADWLMAQPIVREVRQVRVLHEPDGNRRTVEVRLSLREPAMPVVLATGARAWVDREGRILPGVLPPPPGPPKPILRAIETGGAERLTEALWLWERLERQLEAGLVTDIHLDDRLDLQDQRGIVLYTRQGSRLVWGRPTDIRFGVDREDKVRDLVHTIRCQGDLSRIATINVRFKEPIFTMR